MVSSVREKNMEEKTESREKPWRSLTFLVRPRWGSRQKSLREGGQGEEESQLRVER